jgi:predicted MFS family arabinose efflux permease
VRGKSLDLLAFENRKGVATVGELISIVSLVMAVIGALAAVFINNRDKQTVAAVVGVAFLVSFFINVSKNSQLILQAACIIAFIISVIGGTVAIFSNEESKRSGAIVTGVVSLGTSLLILFSYLGFHPF